MSVFITGAAGKQLQQADIAARRNARKQQAQASAPPVAPAHGSRLSTPWKIGLGSAAAGAALLYVLPKVFRHDQWMHGPRTAIGLIGAAAGVLALAGCSSGSSGSPAQQAAPPGLKGGQQTLAAQVPAEFRDTHAVVDMEHDLGTYTYAVGWVPTSKTTHESSSSGGGSTNGSSDSHIDRHFFPDSQVTGSFSSDSSWSSSSHGVDTTYHMSGNDATKPLVEDRQLGLVDGYRSVLSAIEDTTGREGTSNGFAVVKQGNRFVVDSIREQKGGIEQVHPGKGVEAVVIGDAVLLPTNVGGQRVLQERGRIDKGAMDGTTRPAVRSEVADLSLPGYDTGGKAWLKSFNDSSDWYGPARGYDSQGEAVYMAQHVLTNPGDNGTPYGLAVVKQGDRFQLAGLYEWDNGNGYNQDQAPEVTSANIVASPPPPSNVLAIVLPNSQAVVNDNGRWARAAITQS
jgi:hypothetical protein